MDAGEPKKKAQRCLTAVAGAEEKVEWEAIQARERRQKNRPK